MMDELKPCPLCGGGMRISNSTCFTSSGGKNGYYGYCRECGMRTQTRFFRAEALADVNRRPDSENNLLTKREALFGSPEKIADVLLLLLPSMEGWCPYCKHWIDDECKVNPHWDCKNALVNWLNQPEEESYGKQSKF